MCKCACVRVCMCFFKVKLNCVDEYRNLTFKRLSFIYLLSVRVFAYSLGFGLCSAEAPGADGVFFSGVFLSFSAVVAHVCLGGKKGFL